MRNVTQANVFMTAAHFSENKLYPLTNDQTHADTKADNDTYQRETEIRTLSKA
jgi:hypothetical protein